MSTEQDAERRVATWLEAGPTAAADWAVDEAIARAEELPQRRFITTKTGSVPMVTAFRLVAAAAVALAIAFGAWRLLPSSSSVGTSVPTPAGIPSRGALPDATFGRVVESNGAGAPAGTWTMSFAAGQLWLHGPNGENIVNQVSGSTATQVSLDKDLNPDICSFGNAPGTYAWALAGSTLTLTAISDPSPCRSTILSGGWTATP